MTTEPLDPAAIMASWSPCCHVLREGSPPEGVMHNAACREKHGGMLGPTIRLIDAEALSVDRAKVQRVHRLVERATHVQWGDTPAFVAVTDLRAALAGEGAAEETSEEERQRVNEWLAMQAEANAAEDGISVTWDYAGHDAPPPADLQPQDTQIGRPVVTLAGGDVDRVRCAACGTPATYQPNRRVRSCQCGRLEVVVE